MTDRQLGMLLVGHGTRDDRGVAEFFQLADLVKARMYDVPVEAGFLELASPNIGEALQRLVERGVAEVVVSPLLLFAAGHAKQDIPNEVATAATNFPQMRVRQAEPLGCHPQILAASAKRLTSCVDPAVLNEVFLVIASRGSSDADAIAHVEKFAAARRCNTSVAELRIGYMAVAEPNVNDVLQIAERSECSIVVVQPHLLFHGKVFKDLEELVAEAQRRSPKKRFIVADYIGPSQEVATAAIERFREACVGSGD